MAESPVLVVTQRRRRPLPTRGGACLSTAAAQSLDLPIEVEREKYFEWHRTHTVAAPSP